MSGVTDSLNLKPFYVSFIDNTLCYPDEQHFLRLVTETCTVLAREDDMLWLEVPDTLATVINSIDIRFIEHQSSNLLAYLKQITQINQSLKLLLSNKQRSTVLPVRLLHNTELYGPLDGRQCRLVLSATCTKRGIVWYAVKVKFASAAAMQREENQEDEVYFQECQLEQNLIKI